MGFSAKQVQALRRSINHRHVRTRQVQGRELSYIEGWYAISEANRIFGFDAWSRETAEFKCILTRENRGTYLAVYVAKVRITVLANGVTVIREGHGTGESRGSTTGEAHDVALKVAETDATKRALATFGNPFGLTLYRRSQPIPAPEQTAPAAAKSNFENQRSNVPPDDTTPIPRPSRYYGRRQDDVTRERTRARRQLDVQPSAETSVVPTVQESPAGKIDKSALTLSEPKRHRDKQHLRFVASQPCLICRRQPSDAHHLRFAQPRALGLKVSDEFTVPLCRDHHQQLHNAGNEVAWWHDVDIKPLPIANALWIQTRTRPNAKENEIIG